MKGLLFADCDIGLIYCIDIIIDMYSLDYFTFTLMYIILISLFNELM